MYRGWEVLLNNGEILREDTTEWREVPKGKIKKLSLIHDAKRWDIENKEAYFIKNRASVVPGINSSFRIEKRYVGWYEGKDKIAYVVDEHTGDCQLKIINT